MKTLNSNPGMKSGIIKSFLIILSLITLIFTSGYGQVNPNSHYVKGHYRSNGTYVNGYYRTNPNSTIRDNYSTYPNVNPYTGKVGTVNPGASSGSYSVPRTTTPSYNTPRITTPSYSVPQISTPTYSVPRTNYPTYSLPKTPTYSNPYLNNRNN